MDNFLPHLGLPRGNANATGIAVDLRFPRHEQEQFLLESIREWRRDWARWEKGASGASRLPHRFAEAGLARSLPDFIEALEALFISSRRVLDIRRPGCANASRDEQRLLALCRLAYAGREALSVASLSVLVLPGAQQVIYARLTTAMASLASAGLELPAPALAVPARLN